MLRKPEKPWASTIGKGPCSACARSAGAPGFWSLPPSADRGEGLGSCGPGGPDEAGWQRHRSSARRKGAVPGKRDVLKNRNFVGTCHEKIGFLEHVPVFFMKGSNRRRPPLSSVMNNHENNG